MMTRNLHIVILFIAFFPLAATAQNQSSAVVKAIKDPKAKENSAKADVYIQDKKIVAATAPDKKKKKCKRNPTK